LEKTHSEKFDPKVKICIMESFFWKIYSENIASKTHVPKILLRKSYSKNHERFKMFVSERF